jgi:glycosyltransferase involved in cell wall biosynthesis
VPTSAAPTQSPALRVAYLSLQAVVEGQESWAAVMEIIGGWRESEITVAEFFVRYAGPNAPSAFARLRAMVRIQFQLARAIRDFDVIYVRGHAFAFPFALWAHLRKTPVVQECNGLYEDLFIAWPKARFARPMIEGMQRWQYRHCAAAVTVTRELGEWVTAEGHPPLVLVSPNAANTETFSPDSPRLEGLPERYAVFFGQFAPWQGISALLAAVETADWPADLPLVIAGDGALRPEVEAAVAKMPERVIYLGRLPYEDVGGLVAHGLASFVPMISAERDAAGLSPLKLYESMAAGTAVIASDVSGLAEVVRGERCGLVVRGGDSEALAGAVATLAADPELAAAMGARGREAAVERHSWATRAKDRADVLRKAVAGR